MKFLKTIYSLIWDDFCSVFLENLKIEINPTISKEIYEKAIYFFEELMQILHPFMPFISEEIYHNLKERSDGDDICIRQQAQIAKINFKALEDGKILKEAISALTDARLKNQLKPKEAIKLFIETDSKESYSAIENIICKQVNADELSFTTEAVANSIVVAVEKDKFYIKTEKELDSATLKDDLLKDLEHQKGFLSSVEKKLSNEKFVQNAKPEVLALEQKKKADAEARIKTIEESLSTIS